MNTLPNPLDYQCNICSEQNSEDPARLMREGPSCSGCGSTVRWRGVIHTLSMGLFGRSLGLWDFPERKDLKGVGLSDWAGYAKRLPLRFDYENTFFDEEPMLDIVAPPKEMEGTLDFLIASDVFEHVEPPVQRAFDGAFRLLKPGGVFVLTVPYGTADGAGEHFSRLHEYEVYDFRGESILVNRTEDGRWEVFDDPVFHGGPGATLEMRRFSLQSAVGHVRKAGFQHLAVLEDPCPEFGIVWASPWGLPILVRRAKEE
jgi:SAM-dependent methyltransferase